MRVFGEDGEEEEGRDEIITEPSSIFNRLVNGHWLDLQSIIIHVEFIRDVCIN